MGMSTVLRVLVVCHCYRENDKKIRSISKRKVTKKSLPHTKGENNHA